MTLKSNNQWWPRMNQMKNHRDLGFEIVLTSWSAYDGGSQGTYNGGGSKVGAWDEIGTGKKDRKKKKKKRIQHPKSSSGSPKVPKTIALYSIG